MYTLRSIIGYDYEHNQGLGNCYSVVSREQVCGKEFNKALSAFLNKEIGEDLPQEVIDDAMEIYAFVLKEDTIPLPLYKKNKYYIMTESGKTFCNLSLK